MRGKANLNEKINHSRSNSREFCLREITLTYEGQGEQIVIRTPDLSTRGMFISTSRVFPEGAVLNLRFRLTITDAVVHTRCEVRYCLAGVGVGVEFIEIGPEGVKSIKRELALSRRSHGGTRKTTAQPRRSQKR